MSKANSIQCFCILIALILWLLRPNSRAIMDLDPLAYVVGISLGICMGIGLGTRLPAKSSQAGDNEEKNNETDA